MTNKREEFLEKPLPSSPETEKLILGAILLDNSLMPEVARRLDVEDFYSPRNRLVFDAMNMLYNTGTEINPILIYEEVRRIGEETRLGGIPDITNLTYGLPHFANLKNYIAVVKEKANLRNLVKLCNKITAEALAEERPAREIMVNAEDGIFNLSGAKDKSDQLITWAAEAERKAQERYDKLDSGEIITYQTFYPELDALLLGGGFWPTDLVIIAGATSGGKSTIALNIADSMASNNITCLYVTCEMTEYQSFVRLHSANSKIPAWKISPKMSSKHGPGIRKGLKETGPLMASKRLGFVDYCRDIETLRSIARYAVKKNGLQVLFVDYIGQLTPRKGFRGSKYEQASEVSEALKALAKELGIVVVALSQLRRKYKEEKGAAGTGESNEVEPVLDMLKDSGNIENDADTVLFIWGEKPEEGEAKPVRLLNLKVAKQRNGALGRLELAFAPEIYTIKSKRQLQDTPKSEEITF